jgi:hypothetical protein
MAPLEIPVLIVDAEAASLSVAIQLARLGIRSLLIELHSATADHPKARGFFTRTMEYCGLGELKRCFAQTCSGRVQFAFIWVATLAGQEDGRVEPPGRDVPGSRNPAYLCVARARCF